MEDELYSERFLVRRPLLRAIAYDGTPAAGAARRRGRPRRRRVRGVPARDPLRLHDHGARARHVPRRDAAGRRRDVEPHARRPRRAQAPVPLPLDRAPRLRARARDPARARARGARGARRGRSRARSRRCATSSSTSRPASPRRSTGPRRVAALGAHDARRSARSRSTLGTVLKYREDQERARAHGLDAIVAAAARSAADVRCATEPSTADRAEPTGSPSRSPACCAAPGSTSRSVRRSRSREGLAAVGLDRRDARVLGGPATLLRAPGGHPRSTTGRSARSGMGARPPPARGRRPSRSRSRSPSTTATTTPDRPRTTDDDGADGAGAPRAVEPGRGAAPPRLRARTRTAELAEARRLMADLRLAGALRRSPAAPAHRRATGAGPTCAARCAARCAPAASRSSARSSRPSTRPAPGRAAVRRERLDGAVRARAAAVPARRRRRARPRRGVRARHPAHAHHARAVVARSRRRARCGRASGSSTGRAAPGSARGCATFNDRWGVRGMARGAVVVILSDGWDRGDPERARRADGAARAGSRTGSCG